MILEELDNPLPSEFHHFFVIAACGTVVKTVIDLWMVNSTLFAFKSAS